MKRFTYEDGKKMFYLLGFESMARKHLRGKAMVEGMKDEIAEALSKGIGTCAILDVMRKYGFKGGYAKFARLLEEAGIYKTTRGHSEKAGA